MLLIYHLDLGHIHIIHNIYTHTHTRFLTKMLVKYYWKFIFVPANGHWWLTRLDAWRQSWGLSLSEFDSLWPEMFQALVCSNTRVPMVSGSSWTFPTLCITNQLVILIIATYEILLEYESVNLRTNQNIYFIPVHMRNGRNSWIGMMIDHYATPRLEYWIDEPNVQVRWDTEAPTCSVSEANEINYLAFMISRLIGPDEWFQLSSSVGPLVVQLICWDIQ